MPDFADFLPLLRKEILKLTRDFGTDITNQLIEEGTRFLDRSKDDLERWTYGLADGLLTQEDFKWLVKSKADLAEMEALKQHGLAQTRIDELRDAMIKSIIGTAFRIIG